MGAKHHAALFTLLLLSPLSRSPYIWLLLHLYFGSLITFKMMQS